LFVGSMRVEVEYAHFSFSWIRLEATTMKKLVQYFDVCFEIVFTFIKLCHSNVISVLEHLHSSRWLIRHIKVKKYWCENFVVVVRCSDVFICYFGRQEKPGSSDSTACCSAN
jgi:hypothetical protein